MRAELQRRAQAAEELAIRHKQQVTTVFGLAALVLRVVRVSSFFREKLEKFDTVCR